KNLKATGGFAGLFSLMNGSVKNLGFIDVDLTCNNWGGAGAIAGYIANNEPTTIENCFVTGKIQGTNAQLGSFTSGNKHEATISNCYSSATLTSTGGGMQGGFVGAVMYINGAENTLTINNSYFAGSITGATVGGFVGANQSYKHPANGTEVININNCALLSATLTGTTVIATANTVDSNGNDDASLNGKTTATVNAENVLVGDKTTIKGAVPAGAVAQAEVVKAVMGWEGFNATEVDATNKLPILAWQTGVENVPAGTKDDPYIIATAEDLCNAYKLVQGGEYWFKQTADIDMKDVKDYHAIEGYNGDYSSTIHYDGQNHLIKNFAPSDRAATVDNGYYCTSIFGVPSGEIS
ncbi:MAG: hypothetical protein K2H75_05660, partial [Muribaculaceae bacterium]|nr:hypothetical protein [Muribaculaceae bacterium]